MFVSEGVEALVYKAKERPRFPARAVHLYLLYTLIFDFSETGNLSETLFIILNQQLFILAYGLIAWFD
jgi:hypothetical protein